jgi:DNA repair protein RadC
VRPSSSPGRLRLALVREPADPPHGQAIAGPADVAAVARALLADEAQEVVLCLHLDGRHRVRGVQEVARGGLAAAQVDLRVLLAAALVGAAQAIVLCHNHPSGDPTPSADDLALTRRVQEAAELLGIELLDHVIVGDGAHASLREGGLVAFPDETRC